MTGSEIILVIIADDHTTVHNGLRMLLNVHPEMSLVVEAPDDGLVAGFCDQLKPDATIEDLMMPDVDGVTPAMRPIMETHPEIRILSMTSFACHEMLNTAQEAGAVSFLLKNISAAELGEAIRAARLGKPSQALEADQALPQVSKSSPTLGHDLTPREIDVLDHLVEGRTNAEMAKRLCISPSTARTHVSSVMSKLGAANRTKAATVALRHNLVALSS